MTDAQLIAAFRTGDNSAFEMLLSRHKSSLYSFILSMVRDEDTAADIFQETFIKVFKNLDRYSEEGKFRGWLYRTASNLAMDHFRRTSHLVSFDNAPRDNEDDGFDGGMQGSTPAPISEEPAEIFGRADVKAAVDAALATLPPEQREVVLLREYADMSFKEIAQVTDAPIGTVLARMSRAVAKLKTALEGTYERT